MKKKSAPWIVIHMAHSRARADEIEARLTKEGFWVQLRPVGGSNESDEQVFEVLTLPSEARAARSVLMRAGL
jgi:hypothetical protein